MRRTPDYDWIKGRDLVEKSKGEDWDAIRHFVGSKDRSIISLNREIQDMKAVFEGIKRYI